MAVPYKLPKCFGTFGFGDTSCVGCEVDTQCRMNFVTNLSKGIEKVKK